MTKHLSARLPQQRVEGEGGCFPAGIIIATPQGGMAIEALREGDEVVSFDENGTLGLSKVARIATHERNRVYQVKFWGGQLRITANHWVLNQFGAFAAIGSLSTEDALIDMNGHLRPLMWMKAEEEPAKVYNLVVEPHHTFIADGIRVHNMGNGRGALAEFVEGGGGGGGGGKGGGGYATARAPVEDPNTLRSKAIVRLQDVIGEGVIKGLWTGDGRSIFFDDTPLVNWDGTVNFKGVLWGLVVGTPDQPPNPAMSGVESAESVEAKVTYYNPVTRYLTNPNASAATVTLRFPAMLNQDPNTGDLHGSDVVVHIDVITEQGAQYAVVHEDVVGKCVAPAERSYTFTLPAGGCPWRIKVSRLTPDSENANIQNQVYWSSLTEVVPAWLSYPHTAYIDLEVDTSQFGSSAPTRSYDIGGLLVRVPSNYDPIARTYGGLWDGTFQVAWTDNPAWCLYDLLTNGRYGCGIPVENIDKWSLYYIGQYCDEPVPDGFGGTEPRFRLNAAITTREEAYAVINAVVSNFRGMAYWAGGTIYVVADKPTEPSKLFTRANVVNGVFTYEGSGLKSRHNHVKVTWNDPDDGYHIAIEVAEDAQSIARYQLRDEDISAFGCTSRGQAHRLGKWIIDTEATSTETVTFKTGVEGGFVSPGEVIIVQDPAYAGVRFGGRILALAGDGSTVTIDQAITLSEDVSYTILTITPTGEILTSSVINEAGSADVLQVSPAFTAANAPAIGAVWLVNGADINGRQFRVVVVTDEGDGTYTVTALLHDPTKYDRVERDLILDPINYTRFARGAIPAPFDLVTREYVYKDRATLNARSAVTVSWIRPDDVRITGYEFQHRRPGNPQWEGHGTTATNSADVLQTYPGDWQFRVRSVGAQAGVGSDWAAITVTLTGLLAPPADVTGFNVVVTDYAARLSWDVSPDLDFDYFEIREGASFDSGTFVARTTDTTYVLPPNVVGVHTFWVKAIDTSQIPSDNAASVVLTLAVPAAPDLNAQFSGQDFLLTWTAVAGAHATREYEIRFGDEWASATVLATVKSTTLQGTGSWVGVRRFWVVAIDVAGNVGTPGTVTLAVNPPAAITDFGVQVIDNNVLLRWSAPASSLPIRAYELRRGATWDSASSIGTKQGTFTTLFESVGGTFTYWITAIDSAGNTGTPVSIQTAVTQPPDYKLLTDWQSTWGGTKTNAIIDSGALGAPVNTTETYQGHFTSHGWSSPDDQISAGYGHWISPTLASGTYVEVFDYGAVLAGTMITVDLTWAAAWGTITAECFIDTSANGTDWTTGAVSEFQVFATSFRYVRITLQFTATGDAFAVATRLRVRLDMKNKNDGGSAAVDASDVGGTEVEFNASFVDVDSITATPRGTSPCTPVVDFVDAPFPTSFKVLLFDPDGNRIDGTVDWSARGV